VNTRASTAVPLGFARRIDWGVVLVEGRALIGLVGQPDAAREMGRRARDAVTHRLSIERTLDDAEALYRRVAAHGMATDSAGR